MRNSEHKNVLDRRIPRTREMLQHALISLILEKDYESITIRDICETADIGRSTFYAHYANKDDLKKSGLDHLRAILVERQRAALENAGSIEERSFGFSLALFEHARNYLDLYRALNSGRGGAVALGAIREILSDLVRNELSPYEIKEHPDAISREFVVQYTAGAFMAVLIWWLDGGAQMPPQRLDEMIRRVAFDGIASLR